MKTKNLIIAIIFVAFGIFALWDYIPAYFESGEILFQALFVMIWNIKFELLLSIPCLGTVFKYKFNK